MGHLLHYVIIHLTLSLTNPNLMTLVAAMEHLQDDRLKRQRDEAIKSLIIDDTPATLNTTTTAASNITINSLITSRSSSSSEVNMATNHLDKYHHHDTSSSQVSRHYACPPTQLHELRKRYGTNKNEWGDWSRQTTRAFYRTNLPRALQIDGALGLTLEERAKLASEARHALRIYARERCFLVGHLMHSLIHAHFSCQCRLVHGRNSLNL